MGDSSTMGRGWQHHFKKLIELSGIVVLYRNHSLKEVHRVLEVPQVEHHRVPGPAR